MRPNKDRRTEIILYGLLLIPLLFAAAALAQATEQTQGLAEITAVLSEILHTPSMLRWCASTPKFLLAVLVLYPLAVYCYMLDQADRHPGAEHGTAKWGSAHRLNIKYRNTKDSKENYILTENVRFSTDSHAHKHNLNIIVIGGSGSGKTRFYVKPNALQLIGSYLFLDPKGELLRTQGRIMEMNGISVTVLDLVHFQGHYNPMAYPRSYRPYVENPPTIQHGRLRSGKPRRRLTGLRALYYRYLYELGALPRKPRRPSYAVRQDAYKLDQRIRQMEFLSKNNINTLTQLETHRQALQTEIGQLLTKRKQLPKTDDVQSQHESVNTALKQLRQEERLCRKIAEHSLEVQQHLTEARRDRAEQQQREQEHERDRQPDITTR